MHDNSLRLEGYRRADILALPTGEFDELIFHGEPIVLKIGSAEILGSFWLEEQALFLELAQIEGGGEGVLHVLSSTARAIARQRGCHRLEWIVHAVPNRI